ncbi:MAG: nucleotidyltransferase domain-containing protein [Epsilonproteobacteria bacterium]|nr:nucleotidyltransferase domain-containing protein [Campylobacterota bacterium]
MALEEKYKKKIISLISALIPEAKIYLYGSRARGDDAQRSDIDIALDSGYKLDLVDVGEVRDVLNATHIPYKLDLVDVHFVSKSIREEIMKDKVIWKD